MGDTQQDQTTDSTETTPSEAQEATQEAVEEQSGADPQADAEKASEGDSEGTEEQSSDDTDDGTDDGDHDELPEWGRKQLTKARKDAANYRRRLAEANEKVSQAKSPEEFEAVQKELASAQLELEAERIANRHGLPDELRQVLSGKTAEEVEAHAKILSKFVQPSGPNIDDLSGGLNPGTDEGPLDPRSLAAKHRRH